MMWWATSNKHSTLSFKKSQLFHLAWLDILSSCQQILTLFSKIALQEVSPGGCIINFWHDLCNCITSLPCKTWSQIFACNCNSQSFKILSVLHWANKWKIRRTLNSNCERIVHYVVFISRCTLKRVRFVQHIVSNVKSSSFCDVSTDQVCPLIGRRWVAFCWTLDSVSWMIDWPNWRYS